MRAAAAAVWAAKQPAAAAARARAAVVDWAAVDSVTAWSQLQRCRLGGHARAIADHARTVRKKWNRFKLMTRV